MRWKPLLLIISCSTLSFFVSSCTNPDTDITQIDYTEHANYDIQGEWLCNDVKGQINLSIPIPGIEDKIMLAIQDEVKGSIIHYKADSTFTLKSKERTINGQYRLQGNMLQHYNFGNKVDILSDANIAVEHNKLTIAVTPEQLWSIVAKHAPNVVDQAKNFVEFSTFNFIFEQQAQTQATHNDL